MKKLYEVIKRPLEINVYDIVKETDEALTLRPPNGMWFNVKKEKLNKRYKSCFATIDKNEAIEVAKGFVEKANEKHDKKIQKMISCIENIEGGIRQ